MIECHMSDCVTICSIVSCEERSKFAVSDTSRRDCGVNPTRRLASGGGRRPSFKTRGHGVRCLTHASCCLQSSLSHGPRRRGGDTIRPCAHYCCHDVGRDECRGGACSMSASPDFGHAPESPRQHCMQFRGHEFRRSRTRTRRRYQLLESP